MPPQFKLQLYQGNSQFYFPFLNPSSLIPKFPRIHTPISPMATQSGSPKRPTCPSCSKPIRICLCTRLQTPIFHNSVNVTILQHSLEKKHPLNSARIATIGLRNVGFYTVSDVNFEARFLIRLQDSSRATSDDDDQLFDEMPSKEKNDEFLGTTILGNTEFRNDDTDLDGHIIETTGSSAAERRHLCQNITNLRGSQVAALNITIAKYGAISSFNNCKIKPEKSFDQLLASDTAIDEIRKGFIVKKLQTKLWEGINEHEESEEFEIGVPPGSVLLFPSERSVDVESINFEVKNLIVLDGTWAKAKRMYSENPWLSLLPHIKLDIDKSSLYSEVRHQPRAGYLSTIESIVYAMKAMGEDCGGLDGLLDVFESMVGDQRRCKNERLSKVFEK